MFIVHHLYGHCTTFLKNMKYKGEHMSAQNNEVNNTTNNNGTNILKHGWGPRVTPAPPPAQPPKTK